MTTARPVQEIDPSVQKTGKIMMGIFGALGLVFCCGGGLVQIFFSINAGESESVMLSYFTLPLMGAVFLGLLASIICHFAVKQNKTLKILIPPMVSILAGPCLLGALAFFYTAIWPSL